MSKRIILSALGALMFYISFAQQDITLEDVWGKNTFSAKGVPGFNSMKNGKYYCAQDDKENIIRYSFATGEAVDTLVKSADLGIKGFSYTWSADESQLLLQNNFKQIYRHSFSANIYVYNMN
ncbi:MAG: S9 family peptidase, partial [Bacteroidia bacterium]|nr:S9 family peptidase [Bacteroidia bacterium]